MHKFKFYHRFHKRSSFYLAKPPRGASCRVIAFADKVNKFFILQVTNLFSRSFEMNSFNETTIWSGLHCRYRTHKLQVFFMDLLFRWNIVLKMPVANSKIPDNELRQRLEVSYSSSHFQANTKKFDLL